MFNHPATLQQFQSQQQTIRKLLHKVNTEIISKCGAELKQTYTSLEIHLSWQKILDKCAHPPAQPSSLPPLFTPSIMACLWTWALARRNEHVFGLQNHSVINSQQSFCISLCGCGSSRCCPGLTRYLSCMPRSAQPYQHRARDGSPMAGEKSGRWERKTI